MTSPRFSLMTLAFLGSFLLNAFLLGLLASNWLGMGHRPPEPPDFRHSPLMTSLHGLPPSAQQKVRTDMEEIHALFEGHMQAAREGFDTADTILTAPTFDEAALRTAFSKLDSADETFKKSLADLIVKIALSLSDDERIRFFSSMPFHPPFPPMKDEKDFPPPHP